MQRLPTRRTLVPYAMLGHWLGLPGRSVISDGKLRWTLEGQLWQVVN